MYPGDPPVEVSPAATHAADGCRVSALRLGSHAGTHVDVPAHTEPDGRTLDAVPVEAFVRDAAVVDCRDLGARDPAPPPRVPATGADCVVFYTGWDRRWGTDRYWDHPYLAPETARRCPDRRCVVVLDAASPDPTPTANAEPGAPEDLPAHHAVLGADGLVVENLRGIDRLPTRVELRLHPLALAVDGAPARVVAVE